MAGVNNIQAHNINPKSIQKGDILTVIPHDSMNFIKVKQVSPRFLRPLQGEHKVVDVNYQGDTAHVTTRNEQDNVLVLAIHPNVAIVKSGDNIRLGLHAAIIVNE